MIEYNKRGHRQRWLQTWRKCLNHKDYVQNTMIIREKNTEREREKMIAENCLCLLEWVRGFLIAETSSWWLRNYRLSLWVRDVARAPKKVGDYSEKGGRLSHSALLPLVTLSSTSIRRLSRYWSSAVAGDVIIDALRASNFFIGPLLRPKPIKV